MKKDLEKLVPAMPPANMDGTLADWKNCLEERGLWDGITDLKRILIPISIYWEILEECEK